MKKTITKFTIIMASILPFNLFNSQIIISSNFENWNISNDSVAEFHGTKSNIYPASASQGVMKIATGGVYGSATAQLMNTSLTTHKRLATNPVSVVENETYEVKYWVKGSGLIRVGIYNNDISNADFGYNYSNYDTLIAVNNWTMFTKTITSDTTTSSAEFLISLKATANTHIEIDSFVVSITSVNPPNSFSIAEVQATTDGDASDMLGNIVIVGGRVTGIVPTKGFYIQDSYEQYSGIYVYDLGVNSVAIGDSVKIQGKVDEFNFNNSQGKCTQITNLTSFLNKGSYTPYTPINISTLAASNSEGWESMLIKVTSATVTQVPNNFGEWYVNDGMGEVMVDDFMYAASPAPVANSVYNVTGIIGHSFGNYKILPRFTSDIEFVSGAGIEDESKTYINVYPTLIDDAFYIKNAKNSIVNISSINGKVIRTFENVSDNEYVSINDFSIGMYIVEINGKTFKIFKK